MGLDPTRRAGTAPNGASAISVSVLWLQQSLNQRLAGAAPPIAEDGRWGANTQGALGQFNIAQGWPTGLGLLAVDTAAQRVLLTSALETALSGDAAADRARNRSSGLPWLFVALGAGVAIYSAKKAWTKPKRGGMKGLRGTEEQHRSRAMALLVKAEDMLDTGNCVIATELASEAHAEASWLSEPCEAGTICGKARWLVRKSDQCVRSRGAF